jgi:hypothetical protein
MKKEGHKKWMTAQIEQGKQKAQFCVLKVMQSAALLFTLYGNIEAMELG